MIEAFLGLPGSGKSLHAVGKKIIPALKAKRLVVTNMPLLIFGLRELCDDYIDDFVVVLTEENLGRVPFSEVDDFKKYDTWRMGGDKGQGPLFVVDECHACFAGCAGLQGNQNPIVKWFAEHRHTGSDVLLMTQMETGIPRPIRGRVEIFSKFIRKGFMGRDNAFRMNRYDTNGVKLPVSDDGEYNKAWFKCYRSHVPGASEIREKQVSIWGAWQFKLIAGLLAAFVAWLVYSGGVKLPGGPDGKPKAQKQSEAVSSALSAGSHTPMFGADNAARLRELDDKIAIRQKERQLERLDAGCDVPAGAGTGLVGGFVGMPGQQVDPCGSASNPYRHEFDQYRVKISGHMFMDARHTYWLDLYRDGVRRVERDDNLQPYGFELTAVSACLAFLKGEHGTYRVTCDGFNLIGAADDQKSESSAVSSSVEYSPVARSGPN